MLKKFLLEISYWNLLERPIQENLVPTKVMEIWKKYILIGLGFMIGYICFYICFQRFFVQRETNNNQNWMMTQFYRGSNMKMKT